MARVRSSCGTRTADTLALVTRASWTVEEQTVKPDFLLSVHRVSWWLATFCADRVAP